MARLSQRDYARHRGVRVYAVQKALKSGRITADKDGKIDPAKADIQWEQNTDPGRRRGQNANKGFDREPEDSSGKPSLQNAGLVYNVARAKREAAMAKMAEIELLELQKKFIPADQIRERWGKIVSAAKNQLLRIPSELRLRKGVSDETAAIVETEIHRALERLADGRVDGD